MGDRRDFLKSGLAGVSAAALTANTSAQSTPTKDPGKMIGIQIGAISFVDEGTEKVLDILQEKAGINTLFLATFTYGRGIAGRQVPGQPLPDHGKQAYDLDFHGGNYGSVHTQYYQDTGVDPAATRAPDHGDLDIIAEVLPKARKRGMKVILWTEDVWRKDIKGIENLQEVDLHGRKTQRLCVHNPMHRNFLRGLVEDYARSYEVDGIMWGSERHGALGTALGSSHGGRRSDPGTAACFCQFCEQTAKKQGVIRFDRVKEGFTRLEEYVRATRGGKHPLDGHLVTFLRIAMRYPEILAWEQFWHDGLREIYAEMHGKAHSIQPNILVGWHIWHNNSFSPFYRAQQDLSQLGSSSDFLKMVMYHNCGGERMASFIESVRGDIYGDMPPQAALDFEYDIMQFQERGISQIPFTGLSADYVYREAKRSMEGASSTKTLIWPGIDIDIPTAEAHSKSTPQGTKDAVLAAFKAGAHGVILSR